MRTSLAIVILSSTLILLPGCSGSDKNNPEQSPAPAVEKAQQPSDETLEHVKRRTSEAEKKMEEKARAAEGVLEE